MRCLRTSFYAGPAPAEITTVARDSDFRDTLESAAVTLRDKTAEEGHLTLTEIFEVPDETSLLEYTTEGMRLLGERAQRELNQAVLYYWTISQWRLLANRGTIIMDKPAPLTHAEIGVVLEALAKHPEYKDFTIISHNEQGEPITLAHGKLKED